MDKIKTVKIKNEDGSISEETYTISVDAKNVDMKNGKDLQDTIGTINIDIDGSIAEQLNNLNENVNNLNIDIKKKAYFFNTVADMKNADLKIGDYACTLGYYEINDGGAGDYQIISGNYADDGGSYHKLNNNLYAELVIKDSINVHQFGAYGNGTHDDTQSIQNIITFCSNNNKKYNIYFLGKTYLIDNLKINTDSINLFGVKTSNTLRGTILKSKNSENPAIFIGQDSGMRVGGSLNNIAIMGAGERQNYNTALNKIGIKMKNIAEFNFTNVFISGFKLGGIYAEDWWDSVNTSLEIRACGNSTGNPALYLGSDDDSCNSLHFYGLHIEECPFQMHINNVCSHIQFTDSKFERGGNFGDSYTHLIEIYEGVYATVFTGCFFANSTTPLHLLIKNNSTTLEGCMFSSSPKQLIKNYSANSGYGKGIIINACQFEGLAGEYPIELSSNNIFSNNKCTFLQNVENNCIKIVGQKNIITGNVFGAWVTGSYKNGIFHLVSGNNYFKNNSYSDNLDIIFTIDSIKTNEVDSYRDYYTTMDQNTIINCAKKYSNYVYTGSAYTLTSEHLINPFGNSEFSIFTNNGNLTIAGSLLNFNKNFSLKSNTIITLQYVSAISTWKIKSLCSLQDVSDS